MQEEWDDLLTPEEAGELLRLDVKTLKRWRHESRGPASFPIGRRTIRYRRSVVEAWIAAREQEGRSA